MSVPSGPVIAELIEAAEQMLRMGNHDGACDNIRPCGCTRGECTVHLRTLGARIARLSAAVERAKAS